MSRPTPVLPAEVAAGEAASFYPETRFMGSKRRLLPVIADVVASLKVQSVLDPFSGSGCVAYMLKRLGLRVVASDILKFAYYWADAAIANSSEVLSADDVAMLLATNPSADTFIRDTFQDLYYSEDDNQFLDQLWANLTLLDEGKKRSIALAAATRACLKKRARGVFTYTGLRYDDGRLDLRKTLEQHFVDAVSKWNRAVFDNGTECAARHSDVFDLPGEHFDLIYIDPPYVTPHSDNEYTRRYHFLEGLVSYWQDVTIQQHTKTKKIVRRETPFQHKATVYEAFDRLFAKYEGSAFVVSYSSNCLPTRDEMISILRGHCSRVDVVDISHTYTFGTHGHKVGNSRNRVTEYLFVAQ